MASEPALDPDTQFSGRVPANSAFMGLPSPSTPRTVTGAGAVPPAETETTPFKW